MAEEVNPFRAALEWFGPNGERWCQDDFQVYAEGVEAPVAACSIGGLAVAVDAIVADEERKRPFYVLLDDTAADLFPGRFRYPYDDAGDFNDHPDTTFDDVRQVFEQAAVRWDEQEILRG